MAPPQSPIALLATAIKIDDPFDWEAFKQRARRGIDRCMSRSGEHLKDEVEPKPSPIKQRDWHLTGIQGSKTQVVIAGATAGLIAR